MHEYKQGENFGRLTLVRIATETTNKRKTWECICECGKTTFVLQGGLLNGNTKSCGCLRNEVGSKRNRHGKWNNQTLTKNHRHIYNSWVGMTARCYHEHDKNYKLYGGRGIIMCDEWKDNFLAFLDWAIINGWHPGLSIDRIDNNENYCPDNCRWATMKTQNNNQRSNRIINVNGETKTLTQWAETAGIKRETIDYRISAGWDMSKWLIQPTKKNRATICE